MNIKDKLIKNWRSRALGAAVIAMLGGGFWSLAFTQWFTYFSYDLPFALRAGTHPPEAVIVFMDDDSRIRLKQPVQAPWDRALHIRLLNELFSLGAKAVVFDVLFDESWPDKSVDENLAAAIKAHGHVVLGASIHYSSGEGEPVVGKFLHAAEPLGSVAPWGVAELPLDSDNRIRQQNYDEQYTNLAWQAATVAGYATGDREKPRWINYYGPSGNILHVSYWQALESGAVAARWFSNKVVFVGMAPIINYQGSKSFDDFNTPYTRWVGTSSPGVEIQTTAFLNLVRGDWLNRLPWPMELGLIMACAFALGFILPIFRPGIAFALGAGFAVLATVAGIVLALQFHEWFCWAVIPLVEVPAGLIWLSICVLNQRTVERPVGEHLQGEPEQFSTDGQPRIPDHELIRFLAKGGYGEVWLAKNTLGTYRAVKIIHRGTFENDTPYEREYRGIEAFEPISRSHEGFVDILHVGRRDDAGYFYYIMELADDPITGQAINPEHYVARTLAGEISKRTKIPCEECVNIGLLLAQALQELHNSNLVHRDIKPANIIFVGGIPKLADIGLVAITSESGSIVGTKGFLAPEGPGSPQADIYSLGKTLYEAAMGRDRCAFPELPTEFAEDPQREKLLELNEILLKACEASTARRYRSAEKMYIDLRRLAKRFKASKPTNQNEM